MAKGAAGTSRSYRVEMPISKIKVRLKVKVLYVSIRPSNTSTSTPPPLNQIIKKYLFFSLQAKVLSLLSPWNANFDTVSQINYWTVRTCCSVNFTEWADCTLSHWLFQNSFILRKTPMAKETKTWQQLQMLSSMVSPKRQLLNRIRKV